MQSVEIRLHPDTGWIRGEPSGSGETTGWLRFVDGRDPDVWALPLFADAFPPSIFELHVGQSWVPTLELTVHVRAVPAPGWLRGRFSTRFLTNGFFEEDGELWDSGGRLVAISRQHAMVL
jgi:acyl-CoA thioesterase